VLLQPALAQLVLLFRRQLAQALEGLARRARCSGVIAAQSRMRCSKRSFWIGCSDGYLRAGAFRRCCW
jgi:hypothetical protein